LYELYEDPQDAPPMYRMIVGLWAWGIRTPLITIVPGEKCADQLSQFCVKKRGSFCSLMCSIASQADNRSLTPKLEQFLASRPETPFLALDLDSVRSMFLELQREFPHAAMHYG
jgi:hypothetical protein